MTGTLIILAAVASGPLCGGVDFVIGVHAERAQIADAMIDGIAKSRWPADLHGRGLR